MSFRAHQSALMSSRIRAFEASSEVRLVSPSWMRNRARTVCARSSLIAFIVLGRARGGAGWSARIAGALA